MLLYTQAYGDRMYNFSGKKVRFEFSFLQNLDLVVKKLIFLKYYMYFIQNMLLGIMDWFRHNLIQLI